VHAWIKKRKKRKQKSKSLPHKMYTAAKHAAVTSISSSSSYSSSSSSSSSSLKLGLTAPKTLVVKFGGRRSVAKIPVVIVPNGSAFEDGMMQLTSDDVFVQACAPWGNLCVSWGTKYVPIGVPSILASLLLFVPLFVALAKIRELEKENFHLKEEMTTKKR
jgi:hypothetical protein